MEISTPGSFNPSDYPAQFPPIEIDPETELLVNLPTSRWVSMQQCVEGVIMGTGIVIQFLSQQPAILTKSNKVGVELFLGTFSLSRNLDSALNALRDIYLTDMAEARLTFVSTCLYIICLFTYKPSLESSI